MIHVTHEGKLLEIRDYDTWAGTPTVGQSYFHDEAAYSIKSVVVDTRKGFCEVMLEEDKDTVEKIVAA